MICCRLYAMQPDASPPGVNIGSVVQALRGNSSRTLLDVRNGSRWRFRFTRFPLRNYYQWERPADVLNQVVPFEVKNDRRISRVHFVPMWDGNQDMSVALCQAMRTNKTVRALELCLNYGTLEERHLTAIEDSLLKNDTLQSFAVWAEYANHCSFEAVREAFERILMRNMCLRKLQIAPFDSVSRERARLISDEEGGLPCWQVDLGDTVSEAIKRNCQAFAVAEALGRVSRSSMLCFPHFGDIQFRLQLLLFFLEEGCQPPRMMLSVAKGLPKY